jgi:hypothetical protein
VRPFPCFDYFLTDEAERSLVEGQAVSNVQHKNLICSFCAPELKISNTFDVMLGRSNSLAD